MSFSATTWPPSSPASVGVMDVVAREVEDPVFWVAVTATGEVRWTLAHSSTTIALAAAAVPQVKVTVPPSVSGLTTLAYAM